MNWRIPILVAFLCFAVSPIALIAQEVFFEEDFGEGAQNWSVIQIVGNGASSGFWRTTTTGPAGVFALNPLNSTTAANGWVQFDSDLNCNPQGQDSWLVSPYIPTEGRTSIILSFETYYRTYNDRPQIRVGEAFTDYFTWDTYEIFPGLAVNDFGGETEGDPSLNPQYIQVDISPSVIGLDSFRFAFQFLSDATTFNGGTQGYGCAYSWQVDDVKLASVREISCGERVFEENFHSDASSYDYSECFSGPPIALPPYRDELYRFELADRQAVRVTLRDFSGSGMLSIMESDINNIPGPCAANNFLTQSLDEQEVIAVLNPGVYWIVVSGFEQGYYELAVDCFPADNPGMISCGQSLIGSTSDSPNTFSGSAYINCRGGLFAYGAGENRYQFTLSEAQAIVASLSSLGALDLDLFLFSNVNGQPGQCLDASYNLYADTSDEIITPLPAGTYWLIVDGDTDPDAGQLGEGPFELSLNCFTDEGLSTISCGQTTTGNTAGQPNNLSAYFECFPNGTANVFGGGERLYRLDLVEEKEVVIRLESLGPDNLALFLLDNGPGNQPGPCRLIGEQLGFTDTVEILASLPAGNYWIAVDGAMFPAFPEDYIAEGPFRLSVDCYEDEGLMVISCGQSTFGSTLGRSSSYSDYSSCFTNGSDNYNAGDRLYRFEISQEQAVAIQLKNLSANNIDLFLMENAPGNQPGACIEKSVLPGEEREEILAKLNAGTYWIQIDGREEFDFFGNLIDAGESPFELTVKCFGLPSICDLEGIYISNGNTVFPELYSAREIPADNFLYIDQIPSSFVEPDAVLGDIFVYYHEGETDFFSLDLNAAAPSVRAFAFDCNTIYSDRSDACLGGTDAGGVLNVPGAGEGFYYIVVFNQEMAYYDLTVLPGGTCSMGEGQYFCFDTALPSNFAGQGNDFNTADDYSDCYSGPIAYDGEDIVVGFRIGGPDLPKQRVDRGLLTIGISLVADGPMGVFLFDYQCGENCLGYAEYSSPGQLVEFSFDDLNLDAGTFYLVLDETFPGAVSDFSIICAPGVFLDDCNFVDPSHEISFSPFAGASLVDSLEEGVEVISISIDYDRNDNAFRDIFYFETFELSRSPDGSFFNVFISGAGINGFKKCGYEEDEKILYRAKLSNDFIAVFDAEYQDTLPPDITAAGRFNATGFGKSRVRRFVLDTISPAPKLFINRKRAALRGVFGQGRGPVSPVFLADLLVNANNRWVVDKGPNSSWYMVTPDIDTVPPFVTQITIEALEENLSTDPRIDTFQILSPSMEPIEVEVIQPPSPCFLNPIGLQANASDATCNTIADGAITVNATGGNGSLYYEWDQGIGAVENPIGLAPGEYILTVRDEVNCTLSDTITVGGPGPISFTQAQASPVTCSGGADGSIAITVQGGNGGFTYSWNGSAGTAEDPTGLTAGAYTVTVTDSEGCTALETVVINEPPAIELAVASATAVSCHGASDGSIAITAGGGTGVLSYAWSNGVGAIEDPTGLAAGDYTLTVTDANGCTLEETVTVGEPPAISITQLEPTDASCNGSADGSISVTATGGTGTLSYAWDNGIGPVESPSGLPAGQYTVTITDTNGCTLEETATVEEAPAITFMVDAVAAVACNGEANGAIAITAGGGTGALNYAWDNGIGAVEDPVGLSAGDYTLTITDGNGCTLTEAVTVPEPPAIELAVASATAVSCHGASDGSIAITAGGGTGALSYAWSNGVGAIEDPTGLAAGDYTLTVTDANGCTLEETITIGEPPAITITQLEAANASCNGSADGSISVTATGGTGTLSYEWDNGVGAVEDPVGLPAGTYTVTITDENGCTLEAEVAVQDATDITVQVDNTAGVSCNGLADGAIAITAAGGTGVLSYEWDNGVGPIEDPSGLAAGSYTVTVADENNCTLSETVTVGEPPAISLAVSATAAACAGESNGSIDITAGGGTGTLSYAWDNGIGATEDPVGLPAGTYTVTVTDANGCTFTEAVAVPEPPAIELALASATAVSCHGASDGSIAVTAGGGTGALSYAWDNGVGAVEDPTGLAAGDYTLTVTDANGCTLEETVTVGEPPAISITQLEPTDASCNGSADGSISITATGGTGALSYEWDNGIGAVESPSGLPAGQYTVTITDGNGCTLEETATIAEAPAITFMVNAVTAINCNGEANGAIAITAGGGTGALNYAWDNGIGAVEDPVGLSAGDYTLTITDGNGCTLTEAVTVPDPPAIELAVADATAVSCHGASDGSIAITAGGGTGALSYAWSNGVGAIEDPTGLAAGDYTLTVTDANGCTLEETITIGEPPAITITQLEAANASCNGSADGSISVTATGGTGTLSYAWGNGIGAVEDPVGLPAGTYTVTITDENGCTLEEAVAVQDATDITVQVDNTTGVSCNGLADGAIAITAAGGTGVLSYEWDNGVGPIEDPSGLAAGSYTVTVADENNCTLSETVTVGEPPAISLAVSATAAACAGESNGSIDITAGGGTGTLSYAWDNGIGATEDPVGLPAGTYTVTVTDANGCTFTEAVAVPEPPAIELALASATAVSCHGASDGSIAVTAGGGTGALSYAWDNGVGAVEDPTGLAAGDYTLTVTDANGCTLEETVTVGEPPAISITQLEPTDASCNGSADGSISITATGGTGALSYEWDNGIGAVESPSGLPAGQYTVTITDGNGCTLEETATIAEAPAITFMVNAVTAINCNGEANGAIAITAGGGTGALNYAWDNGIGAVEDPVGLSAGDYTLTITDGNGCTLTEAVTVPEPPAIELAVADATAVSCHGASDGSIAITAGGGTGALSYTWDNGVGAIEDPTGLAAGDYTLTVTDANGCTLEETITIGEPPAITITQLEAANASCNGSADGSISVTATGGTGTLSYAWGNGIGAVEDPVGLPAGTYTVTITDENGCTLEEAVAVQDATDITVQVDNTTGVSCNGLADGAIAITAAGGTGVLSYEWDNGVGPIEDPSGLAAGSYTVTVTDENNCTFSETLSVEEPPVISLAVSATAAACAGESNGSIDITAGGGTGTLSYAWDNGIGATEDPVGLPAGTYTVTVTDENNCTFTEAVPVPEPPAIELAVADATAVSCHGASDGSIAITAGGGTGSLNYAWDNGVGAIEDPTGLATGDYTLTVTDANGCTLEETVSVEEPPALVVTTLETQGATCGGFADGAIEITVTGGTGNLNYEWDNGAGQEEDPSGLVSGVYNVIVSDANQCTITASATVQDATGLTLAIDTVSAVSCFGAADGAVDITASGGAGMLSYAWSGGAGAVEDPAGLPPGAYIVTVTDENNCTRTDTAFVEEPPAITIVVDSLVSPACFGDEGGAILITAAGGAGQLSYAWNNGLGIAEDPMGVLAGAYTVTVADGNGCTAEETVTLTQPPALNFGAIEVTDATCPGFADGAVDVSVTGGSGVLTYQWSAGAGTVEDPQGLFPGAYSVTVTDENGCSIGTSVLVEGLPPVVPEITGPTTLCMGSSTILDAGFGYATYQWSNGEQGQTIEVDEPNAYSVTVTSEAGCSGADGVLVEEVESLEVEIQGASFFCAGTSTTLDAGEYDSYLWSSGQMGRLAMINAPGLYAVTVTDESGCMGADSIEVAQAPAVDVGLDEVQHISCFGLEDGAIIATASGGAGQLLFEWSQGLGGSENLMNLGPGDYNLTVTDENGCFGQLFVTIQEPDSLQVEMASTDATSPAGNDGTATAIPQGGVSSYTYQWSNGGSTPTITGLEPGVYEVTVTDRNGCQAFGAAAVKLIVSSEELAFLRSEVELFPNPASQKVYLRYSSPAHLEIEWSILDLFGRQLQQGLAAESRKAHEIDISQLPKGVYFIRLRLEGAYFSRRLAVQ